MMVQGLKKLFMFNRLYIKLLQKINLPEDNYQKWLT